MTASPSAGPRRRWWHRLPVRLRHHWRPVALFLAFLVVTMGVFGSSRVVPYITGDDLYRAPDVTEDVAGAGDLFDAARSHSIELTFDTADYQRLLQTWYDEREKEYLQADAVIDGVAVPDVGVRLKGNSTLMSLSDPDAPADQQGPGAGPPGGAPPGGGAPGGPGGGGPGGPGGVTSVALSEEHPENLPWLISFDEFAEGRQFQGRSEIAVRPASATSTVGLNEAVALATMRQSGQVTQDGTYARFTVNGQATATRLVVEHPDEAYTEREFDGDGVLYKSRASSSFTDQGEDPTAYEDDFNQINRIGSQDLAPVIGLVRWVQNATDEEFAADLDEHVDVGSLARYLASQNLLLNFDDMGGPGKNYYLWYDLESRTFEVITWDLNFSFGGEADSGPHEKLTMGAMFGGLPGGGGPPAGMPPPGGAAPGAGPPAGGLMQGNTLKDRFLATPAFKTRYEQAYRELYEQMYARGGARTALDAAAAAAVAVAAPAEKATIEREAQTLRDTIEQRRLALARDPVITTRA